MQVINLKLTNKINNYKISNSKINNKEKQKEKEERRNNSQSKQLTNVIAKKVSKAVHSMANA